MNENTIIKGSVDRTYTLLIPVVLLLAGGLSFLYSLTMASSIDSENVSIAAGVVFILLAFFSFCLSRCEITVTNKRVYGKALFGMRVDLPIDSISAVGTSWFKGISVSTSSGRITFFGVSNRDEIHKVISNLLLERQDNNFKSRK